ncbi:dynein light chain roadblock-type 1 [Scaptodrosophila lebanonensis]|uniref:Dynein light chain roadblock-type 1 n=1 Tax=Drosophila lebanonensis TaxID=7225 RepID=A0A6J2TRF9_DROLE|nr:dynein light chain roadblock-type 1 [Scaptodrosophila lebanonensis]
MGDSRLHSTASASSAHQLTPTPRKSHGHSQKEVPREKSYDGDTFIKHFSSRGAREIIVTDSHGKPLRWTVPTKRCNLYVSMLKPLVTMARNVVRDLDPSDDVTFLRMRSESREVLITLGSDFILIVIQNLRHKRHDRT